MHAEAGSILDRVRDGCRAVAAQARSVAIAADRLPAYAAALAREPLQQLRMDPATHLLGGGSDTTAFLLVLDAVNFGSGYFPEIFSDPRRSGYGHLASALTTRFREKGAMAATDLAVLSPDDCLLLFRLDASNAAARELALLFASSLQELGNFLLDRFEGSFDALVGTAGGSASRLVETLREMRSFRDEAHYRGLAVPFWKRAQLAAADLHIAFAGEGPGSFADVDRLTICADNLVPHVLRHDGVLRYRPGLAARIDAGEPIPAGSEEEVEIRACAVQAAELLLDELRRLGLAVNAMQLDNFLWHRGQAPAYRSRPRHRTRTPFY